MRDKNDIERLQDRVRELETALLSKEHLDVQSVLAYEAGQREALLGLEEWAKRFIGGTILGPKVEGIDIAMREVAAECRRRAEELP